MPGTSGPSGGSSKFDSGLAFFDELEANDTIDEVSSTLNNDGGYVVVVVDVLGFDCASVLGLATNASVVYASEFRCGVASESPFAFVSVSVLAFVEVVFAGSLASIRVCSLSGLSCLVLTVSDAAILPLSFGESACNSLDDDGATDVVGDESGIDRVEMRSSPSSTSLSEKTFCFGDVAGDGRSVESMVEVVGGERKKAAQEH
jgi:hypothetical protein